MMATGGDIQVDVTTGAVVGATARERVAIEMLRASTRMLLPFHLFGSSYVARFTRRLLPSDKTMTFHLAGDAVMRTGWCDHYWSVLAVPGFSYEASVRAFLAASRDVRYGFIDGGANCGYWSILASSRWAGSRPVVAIEAAADTFARLDENRLLNGSRFVALNKAIGAATGDKVRIYGAKHEQRTTVAPSADAVPILDTETISLDDIAAMPAFEGVDKFVVKLDVEGVEIAAFGGAQRLLGGDTVFAYEEHGGDRDHATTKHAMDELGLRVFWLGEGAPREVLAAGELDAIKKSRRFGYDMVASRSPFWIARLENMTRAGAAEPCSLRDAA
jgi:FkbM family methyltransferase